MDIEQFAIRAAKGNNGGEWSTHYTEEQKEYWRQFVRDLVAAERERCAQLIEIFEYEQENHSGVTVLHIPPFRKAMAAAIRKGE
jgi:hypothetical protein